MIKITTVTKGKRTCEIVKNGEIFISFNWINKPLNIMSATQSSKDFKTLKGAEKFANKFVSK